MLNGGNPVDFVRLGFALRSRWCFAVRRVLGVGVSRSSCSRSALQYKTPYARHYEATPVLHMLYEKIALDVAFEA